MSGIGASLDSGHLSTHMDERDTVKSLCISLIASLIITGCNSGSSHTDFDLPTQSEISIHSQGRSRVRLDKKEVVELNRLLNTTRRIEKTIYTKPDIEILCKSNETSLTISVFLKENLIYRGHYLLAWDTRMNGRSSTCYELTPEIKGLLSQAVEANERKQ